MGEGIRAGLFGAAAAWTWLFIADVVRRTPFRTAVLFGRGLLAVDRVALVPAWASVLVFSVFLFAVWIGFASAAALAIRTAAKQPAVLLFAALILILLELAAVDLTTMLAQGGVGRSMWPGAFASHLTGWVAVWWYLVRRHPGTLAELRVAGNQ